MFVFVGQKTMHTKRAQREARVAAFRVFAVVIVIIVRSAKRESTRLELVTLAKSAFV